MKKTLKRLSVVVFAAMMITIMTISTFAASVTRNSAINTALKDAKLKKSAVTRLKSERDDGMYEIEFRNKKTGDEYEYEINARTGKIKEVNVEYKHKRNTSRKKIAKNTALSKAAKASGVALSKVKKGSCRYKKDGGEWIYEIKFTNGKTRYEYEVLAPTGQIIEYSKVIRG